MTNNNDIPPIAIMLMSYGRSPVHTDYALLTIASMKDNLKYDGRLLWYVASNCGNQDHHAAVLGALDGQTVIGQHNEPSTCGVSWNRGLVECYRHTPLLFVLEEDWTLPGPFDLTPYAHLLMHDPTIGMIRFGTLTLGMQCEVIGRYGRLYLQISKQRQYAYSGNPHLRHVRLNQAVGLYNEVIEPSPGDVEIDFDYRFRQVEGIEIVRPADLPGLGIFQHIGSVQSYDG